MPIYEYRCGACGFEKEYLQKLADAPIQVCERCGQAAMSKLMSAAGFQLKGSGWYVTDFKNSGAKAKAAEGDGKADTDKKADADQKDDTVKKADTDKKPDTDKKESAAKDSTSGSTESAAAPRSGPGSAPGAPVA
jgi:putative FmdB family regulatory protein